MPGPVLHLGAVVMCSHGGQALPTAPVLRVLVSGQPVATMTAPYAVAGCGFVTPCVAGTWVVGSLRVLAMGQPLALQTGVSVCAPSGTPLVPAGVQSRVIAT